MRNNRLIISNSTMVNDNRPNVSMRVTSIERATEIVNKRNERYITKAVFKDKDGNYFEHNKKVFNQIGEPII